MAVPVSTGNSSEKDCAVDVSVSLWIGGLLFSLPLLAVKLGFGLERGGFDEGRSY